MAIVRIILGVIGGYAAMAVLVLVWAFGVTVAVWPDLRPVDGQMVYPPHDHPAFLVELPVNLVAAFFGGMALSAIAGKGRVKAAMILFALMLLFGVANWVSMGNAKPWWSHAASPILAACGIAAGMAVAARLQARRQPTAASTG
jgi:hypothetical protein